MMVRNGDVLMRGGGRNEGRRRTEGCGGVMVGGGEEKKVVDREKRGYIGVDVCFERNLASC